MSKVNSAVVGLQVKAFQAKNWLKSKMAGDQTIVVALILIAIAVGLCILFRENVMTIMDKVSARVLTVVNNLVDGTVKPIKPIGGAGK